MIQPALPCAIARERLSARLDGELGSEPEAEHALRTHLADCVPCRAHERALSGLARAFETLAEPAPLPDLWARIQRRARRRSPTGLPARAAAGLIGFLGLTLLARALTSRGASDGASPHASTHLLDRLTRDVVPDELFDSLPEYRLLRAFPTDPPRDSR